MGTWSLEFFNVDSGVVRRGLDLTTWLRGLANTHVSSPVPLPSTEVSIVYFPPRDWLLSLGERERLVLPRSIELRFAPGARLIPLGQSAVLEVQGRLTAPVGPIFATRETFSRADPLATVALTSPLLERIHPEWWGAGRLGVRRIEDLRPDEAQAIARVDRAALEAAIRVAMFGSTAEELPEENAAIPLRINRTIVELLGSYLLDGPVRVFGSPHYHRANARLAVGDLTAREVMDRHATTLEIEGRAGDPDAFTLRTIEPFRTGTMFAVADVVSLRLQHVVFESSSPTVMCVSIVSTELDVPRVIGLPHEFRHCRFRVRSDGATVGFPLVSLGMVFERVPLGSAAPTATTAVVPAIQFEGCVFESGVPADAAVRLRGGRVVSGADFRGCTFAGTAMAMIHATAFHVAATGCRFENRLIPRPITSALQVSEATLDGLHAKAPEGGVDIYLGQEVISEPPPLQPQTPPPPDNSRERAFFQELNRNLEANFRAAAADREAGFIVENKPGQIVLVSTWQSAGTHHVSLLPVPPPSSPPPPPPPPTPPTPGPFGSVTAQDCRSTSAQFLVTANPAENTPPMRDATIIGLHHQFPLDEAGLTVRLPAIQWRAHRPPDLIASVLLIGCRFDGAPGLHPRIMTPGGDPERPSVYDYGIVFGDAAINISGPREVLTPGVVSSVPLGAVKPEGAL